MGIAPQHTNTYAQVAHIVVQLRNSATENLCVLMHQTCHHIALTQTNHLTAVVSMTHNINPVPRVAHHCIKIISALAHLVHMDAPLLIATELPMFSTNALIVETSMKK